MLDQSTIDEIEAGFAEMYSLLAGDPVTYVDPDSNETSLLTINYDLDEGDGLVVDRHGVENHGMRELIFLSSYLDAQGVSLNPRGHFKILGERWDFAAGETIRDHVVPIAGIHNLVIIHIRKAVEKESSSGTGSSYDIQW